MGTKERCMVCHGSFKNSDTVTQLEDGSILHDSCGSSELFDSLYDGAIYKAHVNYGRDIHRDWK